ncbi:hypothetical protein [Nonomuraea jiangxiensis]|uniref:Uncharacterized protein n=1 Tax=Nonomuraea jiangxiensis TaxID=633440 RepID=A0A1G9V9X7_9ACTN|nr:hypothetical protein [Nonomuraea jiangxiensis]SDM68856.1 hypothetical protein SAMN05421869_15225 [Nonomuraea jiangxiensis]
MTTRSTAVLATGSANAAKLFVAALAFTSAYVGFSAYSNATAGTQARPAHQIVLSARELPVIEKIAAPVKVGEVTLSALAGGSGHCAKEYVARGRTTRSDPAQFVTYGWKLTRWSQATKTWRTYLADYDGFSGGTDTAEWRLHVSGDPGWYRVELSVAGAEAIKSDRFQVSC